MKEQLEIAELRDLFAGARESPVPVGVYAKYMASQENRQKADKARQEREERDEKRREMARKQYEQTQARRAAVRTRKLMERNAVTERNQDAGREIREKERLWAQSRRKQIQELKDDMKGKVQASRGNDARLDALEAAVDEQERTEATADKLAREKLIAQARAAAAPRTPFPRLFPPGNAGRGGTCTCPQLPHSMRGALPWIEGEAGRHASSWPHSPLVSTDARAPARREAEAGGEAADQRRGRRQPCRHRP